MFVFATLMSIAPMCTTSLYSSVVERQSCKLKVLGSIPSGAPNAVQTAGWKLEEFAGPFAEVAA